MAPPFNLPLLPQPALLFRAGPEADSGVVASAVSAGAELRTTGTICRGGAGDDILGDDASGRIDRGAAVKDEDGDVGAGWAVGSVSVVAGVIRVGVWVGVAEGVGERTGVRRRRDASIKGVAGSAALDPVAARAVEEEMRRRMMVRRSWISIVCEMEGCIWS
jgi:hypothetical protein